MFDCLLHFYFYPLVKFLSVGIDKCLLRLSPNLFDNILYVIF